MGQSMHQAMLSADCSLPQIMCDVTPGDIQEHVRARLEAEQRDKEAKRKEKLEAHLYTIVKLVRDADIGDQIGTHRWFDLASPEKVDHVPEPVNVVTLSPCTNFQAVLQAGANYRDHTAHRPPRLL